MSTPTNNNLNTSKKEKLPKRPSVQWKNKIIELGKSEINPNLSSKTVLTDSTWQYVAIWLKSTKKEKSLFYWEQARNFFESTLNLPIVAKPLTAYYCFLNATKALLEAKNINYDLTHGVSGKRNDGHFSINNEIVIYKPAGVVSALSVFLKEPVPENGQTFTLKDILYNIPYIHRAFTLTYRNSPELFVPIINPRFVFDKNRNQGWFEAQLEPEHSTKRKINKLKGFGIDKYYDNSVSYTIRRNKQFKWETSRNVPNSASIDDLKIYHGKISKRLKYIYSPNDLWYIKRDDLTNGIINKSTLTLTIGAMHRLSELARYDPQLLSKHLEKNASWLITEFINKSLYQFIDQISSEITGDNFRVTGFRN